MFSPVLRDVVTSTCISSPRAPHWICITQAAEKGWKWSLSGTNVQRRGFMQQHRVGSVAFYRNTRDMLETERMGEASSNASHP